jgi:hypothetical protein
MPKLSADTFLKFGEMVNPYQRKNRLSPNAEPMSVDDEAEKTLFASHNLSDDGLPEGVHLASEENTNNNDCYLWVIDNTGIKVLWEQTHCESDRGYICHTNITGGEKAYHGGELWFVAGNKIILNHDSGRYDHGTPEEKAAVKAAFESLGFEVLRMTDRRQGRR